MVVEVLKGIPSKTVRVWLGGAIAITRNARQVAVKCVYSPIIIATKSSPDSPIGSRRLIMPKQGAVPPADAGRARRAGSEDGTTRIECTEVLLSDFFKTAEASIIR